MSTDEAPDTTDFEDAADAVAAPHEPTYPVSVGARALHKSEAWYLRQLKAGALPGHWAGRTWFLTAAAIEHTGTAATPPQRPTSPPAPQPGVAVDAAPEPRDGVRIRAGVARREDPQASACSPPGHVHALTDANSGPAGVSCPCHHPTRGGNRNSDAVNE